MNERIFCSFGDVDRLCTVSEICFFFCVMLRIRTRICYDLEVISIFGELMMYISNGTLTVF